MNAIRQFSGVERAAVLMMLVDEDEAAEMLRKLNPEEVRELGKAMFAVSDVSEAEVEQVLDDFVGKARNRVAIAFDPRPRVETVIGKALGPELGESVMARIAPPQPNGGFTMLDWYEPEEIAEIIEPEHPQVIAVLLANLDPGVAARVLEHLPEAAQPNIVRRVARLDPVPPEAIATLKAMLAQRTAGARRPGGLQFGGTQEAAKIMSSVRKTVERQVMPRLARIDREVAKAIEEAMFVFDNLLDFDDKNLGTLIRNIDGDVLVRALKGADAPVRERFLACMSSRAADGIRDELEARGPMKLVDALDAQKTVIDTAKAMVKDGTLILAGKGDDDYV
jgi:flagellar motor switch protein FliG